METVPFTPPADIDTQVWTIGPLDRRQVAGLIAELYLVTPNGAFRPRVTAHVAGHTATLFIVNCRASAMVLLALLDAGAEPVEQPKRPRAGYLGSIDAVSRWATAPTRSGVLLTNEAAA